MELDDLKKSWNALDKQLQKENIVDEKQIAELIAKYQAGAKRGLDSLSGFQKMSLVIATLIFLLFGVIILVDTSFLSELKLTAKVITMSVFILLTLVFGFWWDIKTYRFGRDTKVAEMSTVEVIERMNTFRRWTNLEFRLMPFWGIIFFALYFWLMDYHTQPLVAQVSFLIASVVITTIIIVIFYKKIFKHLNEINKNLKELKELEDEDDK